ncbi:hypothetical protein [Synechococcus sp. EJ6-Ellesmere]|uniref:hypothetical protein n=1 Tax=Synechococcus sp. EJ6-Ellesmere TaxID=2823734 RepID=UPI0020CFBE74|nr:hypothetical protein [Synechococcus sp. EJ6-Ellesmere]MCP9826458.1 neutral zinc metallopeptidase [Synechococcus sp. EJ6-Ellesmere]
MAIPALPAIGKDMDSSIEAFSEYLIRHWSQDPKLKKFPPPQIITNIKSDSKVIGGCIGINDGQLSNDVGGTSYCSSTNTIFVVPDQIEPLHRFFGRAAVNYVLAHEYGHYLQNLFQISGEPVVMELQADCLAGAIIGQGYEELKVTQQDIVNMALTAYSIGDKSHGAGPQRAYAVYTGLGQSDELTCKKEDIAKLSLGQIQDPVFKKVTQQRSAGEVQFNGKGPNLRTISGSMGI